MGRVSDARARLIEAAIDLIWRNSYGEVGVDAICERAGVRKGSFYHFFPSKDDLVAAALDANWQARKTILDGIFGADLPPRERWNRYFEHLYHRQTELRRKYGRVVGCLYASIGTECVQHSPVISEKTKAILNEYVRVLECAIRDTRGRGRSGAVRKDAKARAKMLFDYIEGVLGQARIHDDPEMVRELRRTGPQILEPFLPMRRPPDRPSRPKAAPAAQE
jgi:TetR/AcrR family transcriptional repressor of nem operon